MPCSNLNAVSSMQSKVMVPTPSVFNTHDKSFISVNLLFCRYGSGKAAISVRVDRQRQLMLVLRFDTNGCGPILLSPVKPPFYLRLKTTNPRRHRPIRQSRRVSTVLSECENEDPRCFYRGHFSWALWPQWASRTRWKQHLYL